MTTASIIKNKNYFSVRYTTENNNIVTGSFEFGQFLTKKAAIQSINSNITIC
jgi:hypothetical protein